MVELIERVRCFMSSVYSGETMAVLDVFVKNYALRVERRLAPERNLNVAAALAEYMYL